MAESHRKTLRDALTRLPELSENELQHSTVNDYWREQFLLMGSHSEDNLDAVQRIEYGWQIPANDPVDRRGHPAFSFKLTGTDVDLSSITNFLEEEKPPTSLMAKYPELKQEDWAATFRFLTNVLGSFSKFPPSISSQDEIPEQPNPNLLTQLAGERLNAVMFIEDYVELSFNGPTLQALTPITYVLFELSLNPRQPGWRDALCSVIGQAIVRVEMGEDLSILFANGAKFCISLRPADLRGPEAIIFQTGKDTIPNFLVI